MDEAQLGMDEAQLGMDEAELAAWQHALVRALRDAPDTATVRARLREAVPWAEPWIARAEDRMLDVAIALVKRWTPTSRT
jgi:hypothetical protein